MVAQRLAHLPLVLEVQTSIPCVAREISVSQHAFPSVIFRDDTAILDVIVPNFPNVNWMSPVQGKLPLVQVKEPYSNLDMLTCRLSSCNPGCTKYTCR